MALSLLPIIGPIIEKVISFIPDPEQKEKARAAYRQDLISNEQSFRDFVVAYEGRGDQVHWTVQIYRSSVRPTVTYAAIIGLFACIWTNQEQGITEMVFKVNLLTLSFWFGSRTLEKLGLNLKGVFKK